MKMAETVGGKGRRARGKLTVVPTGTEGRMVTTADNKLSKAEAAKAKADEALARKEAKQAQLISYFSLCMTQQSVIDRAAAALKAARDEQNSTLDLAVAAGFLKGEVRELMADAKAPRKDLQAKANRMAEYRRWLGQPVEQVQGDLEALTKTPVEVRDELYYNRIGYNDGLYGRDADPPEGMEPRFGPHYLGGWNEGQARLIWAKHIEAQAKVAKQSAPPAPVKDEGPSHPSEVTKDQVADAKAALDKLGKPPEEGEDGFEASPEELAAQQSRRSVMESKDPGATSGDGEAI